MTSAAWRRAPESKLRHGASPALASGPAAQTSAVPDSEPPAAISALDRAFVSGVLWTSAGRYAVQMVSWASSLLVARLLQPADYGIANMAWVFVGLAQILAELGIGTVVVQRAELPERTARALATLSVSVGLALAVVSVPMGILMARFYEEPALAAVVTAYGAGFIVSGLRSVPTSLMSKQLDFRHTTQVAMFEGACAATCSVSLAWAGFGYWSLVIGNLAGGTLSAALSLFYRPCWPLVTGWIAEARSSIGVCLQVLGSRFAWYAYSNADFVVVGRVLGTSALGQYSLGWQLASLPIDRIASAVTQVAFPVVAAARSTPGAARRYFLGLLESLLLVLLPLSLGGALLAREAIVVVLGPRWLPAAPVLALLLPTVTLRVTGALANQLILAQGDAGFAMRKNLWALLFMPPAFYVGSRYDIIGVALAWTLMLPALIVAPSLIKMARMIDLSARDAWAACSPSMCASLVLVVVVLLVKTALADRSVLVVLSIGTLSGAAAYVATLALGWPNRVRRLIDIARHTRTKGEQWAAQ